MPVSALARQRITEVCDFINFLRYLLKGIIKYEVDRIYDEIVIHRRQMALSRIGSRLCEI